MSTVKKHPKPKRILHDALTLPDGTHLDRGDPVSVSAGGVKYRTPAFTGYFWSAGEDAGGPYAIVYERLVADPKTHREYPSTQRVVQVERLRKRR